MPKKFAIMTLALAGLTLPLQAFEFTASMSEDLTPHVEISRDDSGITVDYTFPGAQKIADDLYPGTFKFAIPGFGQNMQPGEAAFLTRWDTFEIPAGCNATVQTLSSEISTFQIAVAPARRDLINSSNETYSLENVPPIEEYSGWKPASPVEQGDIQIYRDRHILYVGVYPISYNMAEGLVNAIDKISYRVSFTPAASVMSTSADSEPLAYHDVDTNFMGMVFTDVSPDESDSNSGIELMATSSRIKWITGDGYLILSTNAYQSAVKKFTDWKKKLGYNVTSVLADDWTPVKIKQTVQEKYDADSSLKYLLLIGDELDLPGEYHKADFIPFYTDYFYACMDGPNDNTPDLFSGRLSVTSLEEATTVINKIIDYENLASHSCHHVAKAVHCAEFSDYPPDGYEDRNYTYTSESIANGITAEGKSVTRIFYREDKRSINEAPTNWSKRYNTGDPIPDFLRQSDFNWKQGADEIIAAINSGSSYVFHRDHGDIQKWANPKFNNSNVESLSNGKSTPVIFSINCLTGMYQYYPYPIYNAPSDLNESGRSTCLAEAFLRKKNGGAVGVIAASQLSGTWHNDAFAMEMFQLIWPNSNFRSPAYCYTPINGLKRAPIRKLGEVLNAAKIKTAQTFNGELINHNTQIYHCFGDPSMEFKDVLPVSPMVTITHADNNQSFLNQEYAITISPKYTLVRVPNPSSTTAKVAYANQPRYELSDIELSCYSFYIIGEDIAVTPLANFFKLANSEESYKIEEATATEGVVEVVYTLPDSCQDASLSIRGLTTGVVRSVDCNPDEKEVTIDLQSQPAGVYVVELRGNGVLYDTKKIMVK